MPETVGTSSNIIFYSSLAGVSTVLGVALVMLRERWVLAYSHYANSFAAGLILGVAFFHLFPESLELSDHALPFVLLGFLSFYVFENLMVIHSGSEIHFPEKNNPQHTKGLVMFGGLFFHSLVDGIIIGVGFEIDPKVGFLTSVGVISHELPEGVTTFALLINSIARRTALRLSVAVAVATPLGALISLLFIGRLSEDVIGALLALACGSFLYISASDLIPETHQERGVQNAGIMFLGILSLYALSRLMAG